MCTLDDNQFCVGCGRSLQEIIDWASMTAEEQCDLIEILASRVREQVL
jgi:predicted Fe-S protein YdhL (DUF1289 family)